MRFAKTIGRMGLATILLATLATGCKLKRTHSTQECPLYADVEGYSSYIWAGVWEKTDGLGFTTSDYFTTFDPMDHVGLLRDEAYLGLYPPHIGNQPVQPVGETYPFDVDGLGFTLSAGSNAYPYVHYMIAYALQYTLPAQPCRSDLTWEANLQLAFPNGAQADDANWLEFEWLVLENPLGDYSLNEFAVDLTTDASDPDVAGAFYLPRAGADWRVINYTTSDPIYKSEPLNRSVIVPANTNTNLFLGVSIRMHSAGGHVGVGGPGLPAEAAFQIKDGIAYLVTPESNP